MIICDSISRLSVETMMAVLQNDRLEISCIKIEADELAVIKHIMTHRTLLNDHDAHDDRDQKDHYARDSLFMMDPA